MFLDGTLVMRTCWLWVFLFSSSFFPFTSFHRMNFTRSLRHFFHMSVQLPILGSIFRLENASTLKNMRNECQRMRKEQSRMSFLVKSLKLNRSGHPGSWPSCAKIFAKSSGRILCSQLLGRSTHAVYCPILTRRARLGESIACDRLTKSGVWI